jgi:large-conductance mechanosensitive channel
MKGAYLFVVFFFIFASAMLLIPLPMFPGDNILAWANVTSKYTYFFSALINGIVYGLVAWAIFMVIMKRLENPSSKNSRKNHDKKQYAR